MDSSLTGVLIVALVALGASVEAIPTECPKHDLPGHTVHLAHETDCTKFYKCHNGNKVVIDCPAYNGEGDKLYFNVILEYCDWPENVVCKSSQPIADNPSRLDIPTTCPKYQLPTDVAVHLAHESDCTKFYKCDHGHKVLFDCPVYAKNEKLYFNPKLQVCDWPENVNCGIPRTTSAITTTTTPIPTTTTPIPTTTTPIPTTTTPIPTTTTPIPTTTTPIPTTTTPIPTTTTPIPTTTTPIPTTTTPIPTTTTPIPTTTTPIPTTTTPIPTTTTPIPTTTTSIPTTTPRIANGCVGECPHISEYPYIYILPHEECTKFCICNDLISYVHYCKEDEFPYWNNEKKRCTTKENSDCPSAKTLL